MKLNRSKFRVNWMPQLVFASPSGWHAGFALRSCCCFFRFFLVHFMWIVYQTVMYIFCLISCLILLLLFFFLLLLLFWNAYCQPFYFPFIPSFIYIPFIHFIIYLVYGLFFFPLQHIVILSFIAFSAQLDSIWPFCRFTFPLSFFSSPGLGRDPELLGFDL